MDLVDLVVSCGRAIDFPQEDTYGKMNEDD